MAASFYTRLPKYASSKALNDAIRRRATASTIQTLLLEGADVNAREPQGFTPLLLACINDNYEDQVMLLVNAGADVNYSITYYTPLHSMAWHGCKGAIRLLAEKGADLNAYASTGHAPILVACNSQNIEVVELLANLGADVTCCFDYNKSTALHYATRFGWPSKVVQLLLKKGADPNARDNHGSTPLLFSCKRRDKEIAELLVKAGADCNIVGECGNTPLRILIGNDSTFQQSPPDVELINLLIVHGAYIEDNDYYYISNNTVLKESILQDIKICSQAILNKFDHKDLPLVYSLPVSENRLPSIELMKIGNNSKKFKEIELVVEQEIQKKGHCNVLDVPYIILSIMSVKSLINYCKTINFS